MFGGTEAMVSVDIDEGRPPAPRCRELAEAAATGGAVIVTIVLATALLTADVELKSPLSCIPELRRRERWWCRWKLWHRVQDRCEDEGVAVPEEWCW